MASWLREPLLHFIVLGAALFAIDHFLAAPVDDPRTIVVGKAVTDEAKRLYRNSHGRDPDRAELEALNRRWIDNEVLYREGLALGVDQGDTMIRDRVIFKALMVVESSLKLPPVDDATLRSWFDRHRDRYDEPARYDFQEAVLAGQPTESAVQAFAGALNSGAPGEEQAGLRIFKGRPLSNLVQSYGEAFAVALDAAEPGQWHALKTHDGWRAIRLDSKSAPRRASFESLRHVVLPDWTDATMAQMRTDAVRLRARKYNVGFEAATP